MANTVEDEVEYEVLDLGEAADLDPATYKVFLSDGDAAAGAVSSWPVAEAIKSKLTGNDEILDLHRRYGVPDVYTACHAGNLGASTMPAEGDRALCVYAAALEAGMRFPLHGFYIKVLRHYRLAPSQLAPNSWTYMAAFVRLCEDAGVEPLVSVFRHFFTISAHRDKESLTPLGWHHFQPFPDHRRRRLFTGNLNSKFGWKSRFFFLRSSPEMSWKCPVKWGKPRRADVRTQQLTDDAIGKLLLQAGTTGIDLKDFLSRRKFPIGDPVQLPTAVKTEAGAGRKRKSPEGPATNPLAAQPGFTAPATATPPRFAVGPTIAAAATPPGFQPKMSTPPGFSPTLPSFDAAGTMRPGLHLDHQGTSVAHGRDEPSLPLGMWASDALQVWEAMTARDNENTQLKAMLRASKDEVAKLKDMVIRLDKERAFLMERLGAARTKISKLEEEHATGIARLKDAKDKEVRDAKLEAKKNVVLSLFPHLNPVLLELPNLD
ncbi:hypothetical protein EJB05_47257, partial [Eragrostis curvula]